MDRIWFSARAALLIWMIFAPGVPATPTHEAAHEAAPAAGPVPDLESECQEAVTLLVVSLEELVDWSTKNKLFAERDRVFEQILEFEPDNFRAHKGLGHSRQRDGTWVPQEGRKEPKNYTPSALAGFAVERERLTRDFRDRMLGILMGYEKELGPARREEIYQQILSVRPDDEDIRRTLGEVPLDGRWVLSETATAKRRRAELKAAVKDSLASPPAPQKLLPSKADSDLGVAWRTLLRSDGVRVLSTGESDEAVSLLRATDAARRLFGAAFGISAALPEDYTLYLLVHEKEELAFLSAHPAVDEEGKAFFLGLEGSGLPGLADGVNWSADAAARLDGTTRHTVSYLLGACFGLTTEDGWAYEGLGLYLTREIVGTRLTWYVQPGSDPSDYQKNLRAKLLTSETNWMNEAFEILGSERRPDLGSVLTSNLNEMRVEDLLFSYVFAAYLIEGRPEQVTPFLERVGSGVAPEVAIRQLLGLELDQLTDRVQRWLGERR
jgi:hypothetical protein